MGLGVQAEQEEERIVFGSICFATWNISSELQLKEKDWQLCLHVDTGECKWVKHTADADIFKLESLHYGILVGFGLKPKQHCHDYPNDLYQMKKPALCVLLWLQHGDDMLSERVPDKLVSQLTPSWTPQCSANICQSARKNHANIILLVKDWRTWARNLTSPTCHWWHVARLIHSNTQEVGGI